MTELTIDNLTFGGRGVGRVAGKAVFVPYTLPGERVRCRIEREHKRYSEATLVEILAPAANRCTPRCPVFAECGGCHWQHLPYPRQLEWKEQIFRESLQRSINLSPELFLPIVASPTEWNYRCRAQVKCAVKGGRFVAGFYRPASHQVVDIEHCPLLAPQLNQLLPQLKELLGGTPLAQQVSQLDLTVDDQGQTSLMVHFSATADSSLCDFLAPFAAEFNCSIYARHNDTSSPQQLVAGPALSIRPLADHPMSLQFPPGGFIQVNLAQNRQLVADVVAQVKPGTKVLDLYCGIGNFSLPLAEQAAAVVGVEDYLPAITAARENAERLGLTTATFHASRVERRLHDLWHETAFDTVLLDPPRAGAPAVAKLLAGFRPRQIIYVSCDPMTLARDLKPLLDGGYRPTAIRPYDMFPQTYHIEGMVVLQR